MNRDKIILDLCGGTGAWSKPYKDAGYDVRVITHPKHDVRELVPRELGTPTNEIFWDVYIKGVYGVLAAPPCTQFSFARTNAWLKPRAERVMNRFGKRWDLKRLTVSRTCMIL